MRVTIPQLGYQLVTCELGDAGPYITRLYTASSTSSRYTVNSEDWWVKCGSPLLLIELNESEPLRLPSNLRLRQVEVPVEYGIELRHCWFGYKGRVIPTWIISRRTSIEADVAGANHDFWLDDESSQVYRARYFKSRTLRLYLLRLHAEHQCLKIILRNIVMGHIPVEQDTVTTENLQWYLNEATRRISHWESKTQGLIDADVAELARSSEDAISPGQRDSLLALLERENLRLNVRRKVERYANVIVQNRGTLYMADKIEKGDEYNIGGSARVGAVGRNARVDYADFREMWNQIGHSVDLPTLADDLSRLLPELRKRAIEPVHDEAVVAVGQAKQAAEEQNGPKALEYLKKAGKWAFDTATDVGVKVAAEVIKQAIS
jgi:hypothetical protein